MSDWPTSAVLARLRAAIAVRGAPAHPDAVAPVLEGRLDPTARESINALGETISAELRSAESAFSYYTIEGLFIALTPLGMMAAAFALLQVLSGDHGELPPDVDPALLDPWKELAPFQALLCDQHEGHDHDPLTAAEECRRALWHLGQAYTAATRSAS